MAQHLEQRVELTQVPLVETGEALVGLTVQTLRESARRCVLSAGLWEYFDAERGTGCGGDDFSWTAAIALHWLDDQ